MSMIETTSRGTGTTVKERTIGTAITAKIDMRGETNVRNTIAKTAEIVTKE